MTNRYLEHHDEKTTLNDEILRTEAAKMYWKQRDFDPVMGAFVDEDKEKEFVADRTAKEAVHGKDQVKKLPATI